MRHLTSQEVDALNHTIVENSFVVFCEKNGAIRKVNSLLAKRLGYEDYDLIGQSLHNIISMDTSNLGHIRTDFAQINPSIPLWQGALNFLCKGGGELWCHGLLKWIINDNGQDYQVLIANELLEYRAVTQSLLYSENLLHTLMSAAPVGIAHTSQDGLLLLVNDQWCELSGLTPAELIGHRWYEILDPEHQLIISEQWLNFMSSGITGNLNHFSRFRILGQQGHRDKWVMVSLSSFVKEKHQLSGYVFSIQDITQMVQIENALQNAKTEAQKASQLKTEFLANVSHEIRTPMNGILGMAEIALGTNLQPEQKRYINQIMCSGRSLLTTMNEILDFSKMESGKLELSPITFKIRDSLEEIMRLLAHHAYEAGNDFNYEIDANVPIQLIGDITRIRQVVSNLVGNAIKFTEKGSITIRLQLLGQQGNTARLGLCVKDTGIGIAGDQHRVIYDPFTQADGSTSRRHSGTGLGLSICQQLLRLMNGRIDMTSKPGLGSQFNCEWDCEIPDSNNPIPLALPQTDNGILYGLTVLVIDTTDMNLVLDLLLAWQMQPVLAQSYDQALQHLNRQVKPFDLIILDAALHTDNDGFDLAEQIKSNPAWHNIPIMMLSSLGVVGHGNRCRQMGIASYLSKPFTRQELLRCMLTLFSQQNTPLLTRHLLRESGLLLRLLIVDLEETRSFFPHYALTQAGFEVVVANSTDNARALTKQHMFDAILLNTQLPQVQVLCQEWQQHAAMRSIPLIGIDQTDDGPTNNNLLTTTLFTTVLTPPFTSEQWVDTVKRVIEVGRENQLKPNLAAGLSNQS